MLLEMFPSPIWVRDLAGLELEWIDQQIDQGLGRTVLSKDTQRHWVETNYHQRANWIESQHQQALKQLIEENSLGFQHEVGDPEPRNYWIAASWVNRYEFGGYMSDHEHPGFVISGVYFHRADPKQGGSLCFRNPSMMPRMGEWPGSRIAEYQQIEIEAQTGRLVLFPSWLTHSVATVKGGEKISISFNLSR
jgi:uncharacterized protein (TIGR02466 family)